MTAHDRVGFREGLVSLASVTGLALLVPFAILLLGAPIALGGRALVELVAWLMALVR